MRCKTIPEILPGQSFVIYGSVRAIPTYRHYRLYDWWMESAALAHSKTSASH